MQQSIEKIPLLVILGPTASGKTRLAVQVAQMLDGEILSADSRQIYRGMDIGTGKDLAEYTLNGEKIPYHLIDIREAGEQYNVNDFQKDFEEAFEKVRQNGHLPVLCGGTGFYIYALLKGHAYSSVPVNESLRQDLQMQTDAELLRLFASMDSAYHELADTSTRKRLIRAIEIADFILQNPDNVFNASGLTEKIRPVIFGLDPALETRRARISARLADRLENGLVEEVKGLLNSGITPGQLAWYGLEYKYVTQFLTGEMTFTEMKTRLETEIHRFAKRQMTFFRKMERDGFEIHWLPGHLNEEQKAAEVAAVFSSPI